MQEGGLARACFSQPARADQENLRIVTRQLGLVAYESAYEAMRAFTAARNSATPDELWLLEHPPVYTLGQAGRPEHLLRANGIPFVRVDRGGQITYHGPGQVVAYALIDLRRRHLTIRGLVCLLEQAVIDLLAEEGVGATRKPGAPGVYVDGAKIAALGLRVKNGCSYHGIALNVDMDLSPFRDINPCGYEGLEVTQLRGLGSAATVSLAGAALAARLERLLRAA